MSSQTILLTVFAALVALGLSIYQYYPKDKRVKVNRLLAFLRFMTLFCLFLLLINPTFEKTERLIEKNNLVLLFDNSASMVGLSATDQAQVINAALTEDGDLQKRFKISTYHFGSALQTNDSLDFNDEMTNTSLALGELAEIYGTSPSTVVLVSDGNQNVGSDYEYYNVTETQSVIPVLVGDTTQYEDVYLSRVNVNKYTFLKNKFPFEATVNYYGKQSVRSLFEVFMNGQKVYQETIELSSSNNFKTVSGQLTSNSTGLKRLVFQMSPLNSEKNVNNNRRELAIEVIDEQLKVGLVSSIVHPDMGTLKKSLEQNEQRSVSFLKPTDTKAFEEFDFFVLYQPNRSFQSVFEQIEKRNTPYLLITGTQTDWLFLNTAQKWLTKESFQQKEDVEAIKNQGFGQFDMVGFDPTDYPPLENQLGELTVHTSYNTLFWQQIRGVELNVPLLFTLEENQQKIAILLGENIWQWRLETYRQQGEFDQFDRFVEQLVRFLSDSKSRNRLEIDYESVFESPALARISAAYFDETYNFKSDANLVLQIKGDQTIEVPMLLNSNRFEADLGNLTPGDYEFTVLAKEDRISRSGRFSILDFNLENQQASANFEKMSRFANKQGSPLFYAAQIDQIKQLLKTDNQYTPIQKSIKNVVPLVDLKWLLGLLALGLALEWFVRKYNGLI